MNPYNNSILSNEEFLRTVYSLMIKNINALLYIEESRKRGKLSLPELKEKYEIVSKILESLKILTENIDYNTKEGLELSDILNGLGINLTLGNVSDDTEEIQYRYTQ